MKKCGKLLLTLLMAISALTTNIMYPKADSYSLTGTAPLTWALDPSPFQFNNPDEAMIYLTVHTDFGDIPAFCVEPRVKSHLGDVYDFNPGTSLNEDAKAIILTYYEMQSHPLWGTRAGYQAAQIAIWGKILGINPSILQPAAGVDASLANSIKSLAMDLYNSSSSSMPHGASINYAGSTAGNNYDLSDSEYIYSYRGTDYYRSELMSVTTSGHASNMAARVTVTNGYISNGNNGNWQTTKLIGTGGTEGNTFYVWVPADNNNPTTVTIDGGYNYPDIASWKFNADASPSATGQNMMSIYKATNTFEKTITFLGDEVDRPVPDELKGRIVFTKNASSPSGVTYEQTEFGRVATISYESLPISDAMFAIYRRSVPGDTSSSEELITNQVFVSDANGLVDIDNFLLPEPDSAASGVAPVWVCEISSPEGYGKYGDSEALTLPNGYTCMKISLNVNNAVDGKVTRSDITQWMWDTTKKFTVQVNKTKEDGTPDAGVVFGLYNTEDIPLRAGSVEAGTLVGTAETNSEGIAIFSAQLPANQNYILRELKSANGLSMVMFKNSSGNTIYNDNDQPAQEYVVEVNGQEEMEKTYTVTAVNKYVGKVTIHKTDGDTNANLEGITFVLQGASESYSMTTNAEGIAVQENIPYGSYTLYEIDAPEEYQSNETWDVVIDATHQDLTYEIKNYKVPVKEVDVVKQIEGPYSEDKTFYFDIKLSKIDGTTPEEIWTDTKTVDGEGTLRFTRGFPEAGTYEFEISENHDLTNYPGYTNDKSVYYYTLKVENVGTGADEHLSITEETLEKVAEPGQARVAADKIEFKNKFELAPYKMQLLLEKEVAITYGTYTGSESWRVNVAVSKDGTQIDSYQRTISPNSTAAASLSVTEPGEYKFTLNEVANSPTEFKPNNNTYTLTFNVVQQGDSLVLANEPAEVDGTTIRKDGDNYRIKIVNEWDYPYTPAKVKVNLEKSISGINPLTISQDNEFEFILYENGVEKARDSMTGRVFDLNGKAYMDFTSSEYETPTEFTLLVKEQAGTNTNWQYSTDEWKIVVHVAEEDAPYKHLVASGEVYKNDILQESVEAPVCTPQAGATENNYCPEYTEFNVNFRNQYRTPDGEYEVGQIEVLKETNIATLPGEEFGFIVERASKVAGVWSEYEPLETRTWGDTKKELVSLKAKNVGEFRYRISEDKTNPIADWKYDDTVYEVTFRAIQDGENIIFAGSEIQDQDGNVRDAIVFSNKYEPAPALKTLRTIDIIKTANIETDQVFTYAYTSNVEAGGEQGMRTNNAHQAKTIEASSEGSFYYEFREVDLGLEGWNSDNTKYRYEYDVEFDETDRTLKIVSERFFINGQLTDKVGNDIKVEFENYYGIKPVKDRITIKKELVGTDLDDRFQFDITDGTNTQSVYIDGEGNHIAELVFDQAGIYEYTITEADMHYEGYVFDDTEYKVRYEIKEADGKYEIVSRDFLKDGEPFVTENVLTFTNTKEYEPVRTQITLKKTWNLEDEAAVSLKSQFTALGSVENNARIMGNGTAKLTYEFTKPGEYTYVIKEVAENNTNIVYDTAEKTVKFTVVESTEGLVVTPSVETLEFNNLYQYPSTRVLIPIEKKITGSPSETKEFIIQVDGEDKVRLTGEGTKTYYRDYKTPGEYVIEVKEKDSGYNNWTFDKTVYKVYVNVYKEGLEMKSTSIIRKGEETVDKIVFTNSYKKEEIPTKPKTPEEICNERGSSYKWNKEKEQCETVYRKPETGINW